MVICGTRFVSLEQSSTPFDPVVLTDAAEPARDGLGFEPFLELRTTERRETRIRSPGYTIRPPLVRPYFRRLVAPTEFVVAASSFLCLLLGSVR